MTDLRNREGCERAATCPECGGLVFDPDELDDDRTIEGETATVGVIVAAMVAHCQEKHPTWVPYILDAADTLGMTDPGPLRE